MQIKLIPAVLLFLGSYFPLALILAIQDIKADYWMLPNCLYPSRWASCQLPELANPVLVWTFLIVTLVSLIFFLFVLKHLPGSTEMKVEESITIPNDLINYVFPYIVSFMGVELSATGKLLGLGLFMVWMFLLSYRSGQILMNPLLLVSGWQLYEIQARIEGNSRSLRALSKDSVLPGQTLRSCLVQGIYVLSKA
jgi:hypothetical protein